MPNFTVREKNTPITVVTPDDGPAVCLDEGGKPMNEDSPGLPKFADGNHCNIWYYRVPDSHTKVDICRPGRAKEKPRAAVSAPD